MTFALTVQKRTSKDTNALREQGLVPAVVYGPQIEPVSISVPYRTLASLYEEAGESSIIDCTIEGIADPIKVLIQDLQYDPIKRTMSHADFRQINMNTSMHATIALEFIGQSVAVKELGGTLVTENDEIEVKCLPKDLVSHIDVDLSVLATFDDSIYVKDLAIPAGMTVLDDLEALVAKVTPPLTEDQIKAMEDAGAQGSVEDIEVAKDKKEPDAKSGDEAGDEKKKGDDKKDDKKKE